MSREELQRALQEIIGTNYGKYQCHKETMIAAAWAINNVLLGAEKSISDFTDMYSGSVVKTKF